MRDGTSVWYSPQHKRWIFQVSFRDNSGKRKTIQRRAKTKSEAERRAIDLARSPKLKEPKKSPMTVADLLDSYIKEQQFRVRPSSLANTVHMLRLYFMPTLSKHQLDRVFPSTVEFIMFGMQARGLRSSTINTARAKIHALFAFAVRKEFISVNPVAKIRPFRQDSRSSSQVQNPWTLEEAKTALAAFVDTDFEVFVTIAIATGMRKGEILGLQWQDIDFNLKHIRVNKSRGEKRMLNQDQVVSVTIRDDETKTRSSNRTLPLSAPVEAVLLRRMERTFGTNPPNPLDYVVVGENFKPISPSYLGRMFRKILRDANVRVIRIHDLRHSAAVLALQAHATLEEVSQGLGHEGVEITKRIYAPVVPALSNRFANRIANILFE